TLAGPAVWLGLAVFFWVAGFDTIYALQDVDFDRRAGLFSLPARWGVRPALWIARACHVLTIVFLIGVGLSAALGPMYFAGVAGIAALLVIEHWLVRRQESDRINLAFFHINSVISLGVLALVCADVLLGR
ncbi:MAG: UbiA family prenyltransferase, partial [Gemmatales bacterium]|nr:UbiA family prenyltransferase [Gemmatales bacterium]